MRLRALLRSSAATYVTPFLLVFVLGAIGNDITLGTTPNYWPSVTGTSTYALPFISTICAGLGAWEGARLTRGRVFTQTSVRSAVGITAPVLAPVVIGGMLVALAALLLSASSAGVGAGLPELRMLLVVLLLIMTNTFVGYCIGRRWTAVLSVPAVLIAAFIANAYPVSWEPLWIRHLVGGGLRNCCSVDNSFDDRALWSAVAFTVPVILACVIMMGRRTSVATLLMSAVLITAGAGLGTGIASSLSAEPTVDRSTDELNCTAQSGITVCLWPEMEHGTEVRAETANVVNKLHAAGLSTDPVFTMAARPKDGETKLGLLPDDKAVRVPLGVVSGLVPDLPACAAKEEYPGALAVAPVSAWLLLTAGVPANTASRHVIPGALALATTVRKQPPAAQIDWYEKNTKAISSCSTKPQLAPPGATE
ncbi:hypothetical protein [Streptomyces sp. NPDC047315]|uniref:DUF7224 domain-containing protein n=1 Tax=Streptomyces sp. NPDC047315 TaxID=3155142 RepID=UPI0033FB86A0